MAVDSSRYQTETYGPIEPLTLVVLHGELIKLQGTLSGDMQMDYDRCVAISDDFIDELGKCINLSVEKYPDDQPVYDCVFDGLQDVIDLTHGYQKGLQGTDGSARLMDHLESRQVASDRLEEIAMELSLEIAKRETRPEPKKKTKEKDS